MLVNNVFELKQQVYLKTDINQKPRIITSIVVCGDGGILYEVASANEYSKHYDFEISENKDVLVDN